MLSSSQAALPKNNNNENTSPAEAWPRTVAEQKLRRVNTLVLILRLAAFCFSLTASVFMFTNSRVNPGLPQWYDFVSFRAVAAANAAAAVYSLGEMVATGWEMWRGRTAMAEVVQVWFDFGHDQVLAYVLLGACAAGAEEARKVKVVYKCEGEEESGFCVQTYIAVALGFGGFIFLAFSSLLSGFRVVSFLITGSRFPSSSRGGGGGDGEADDVLHSH